MSEVDIKEIVENALRMGENHNNGGGCCCCCCCCCCCGDDNNHGHSGGCSK